MQELWFIPPAMLLVRGMLWLTRRLSVKTSRESTDREDGYTLIELAIVVVIILILVLITIPLIINYQRESHDRIAQHDMRAAQQVYNRCYAENGHRYPAMPSTVYSHSYTLHCGGKTETVKLSRGTLMDVISMEYMVGMRASNINGTHTGAGSLGHRHTFTVYIMSGVNETH